MRKPPALPVRRAGLTAVVTGRLAGQASLPVTASTGDAGSLNGAVAPLVAGGLAIFTDGNSLYALRLGDGRPVWHRQLGPAPTQASDSDTGAVARLWSWHGAVVALTGVNSKAPALVSLKAATGAVRWRTPLGSGPLELDTLPVTTDGIAVANTGRQGTTLTALDLSDGKRLWSRAYKVTPLVQVSGPDLAVSSRTRLTSTVVLTGLRARTGVALWSSPGRVYVPDPTARLYLASLATGKIRWSVPGHTDPEATPVITSGEVVTVATTPSTGTVTARSAQTGAVTWRAPVTNAYGRYLARPAGPNLLVAFPGASASKPSRLLALDAATGATRATHLLPATATVGAPLTVAGGAALAEPLSVSCVAGVHP